MTLPKTRSWILTPAIRWFDRCNRCCKRSIVSKYYECYGKLGEGWWYECSSCFIASITAAAEKDLKALRKGKKMGPPPESIPEPRPWDDR